MCQVGVGEVTEMACEVMEVEERKSSRLSYEGKGRERKKKTVNNKSKY